MSTLLERVRDNEVRQKRNARLALLQHIEWHRLFDGVRRCPKGNDCPVLVIERQAAQ